MSKRKNEIFKSERHNVFTEKVNKIGLSWNDGKRIQSIDLIETWHNAFIEEFNKIALSSNDGKRMHSINSIETYAYGMSKELVRKKERIKCNKRKKRYKKWLTLTMLQRKR